MLAADGKQVGGLWVGAGAEGEDVGWVFKVSVHVQLASMPPRTGPNPWLLLGLSLASFATFYSVVKSREETAPASQRPRQADHPLVPPRHVNPPESDKHN